MPRVPLYALNLFDLADNDDYLAYSRRSAAAVGKHGGRVVALGRAAGAQQAGGGLQHGAGAPQQAGGGTPQRQVMVLVEWPSREAFDAFLADPEHEPLHPLREGGTRNYLWWLYERLEDLRPVLKGRMPRGG